MLEQSANCPTKVSSAEAARRIGVCKDTLRKLRKSGAIGYEQISPRKIFFYTTELESFLKRKQQPRLAI